MTKHLIILDGLINKSKRKTKLRPKPLKSKDVLTVRNISEVRYNERM